MVNWYEWPSNFSNGTAIDGIGNYMLYANYVAQGWLPYAALIIIFSMSFIVGMLTGTKKALLASSFITFVFAVYFIRILPLNPVVIFALIVMMIIGALGSKSEGQY